MARNEILVNGFVRVAHIPIDHTGQMFAYKR